MDLNAAKKYLESFLNHEWTLQKSDAANFHLDRIQKLCEALGNPQDKLKIIHVAGSKGKGSICSMIGSILRSSGYRVGLYTSPHLYDYKERIRILDSHFPQSTKEQIFADAIEDYDFYDVIAQLKPLITQLNDHEDCGAFTFYEIMTALAFVYFYQKRVDFVVCETGLGGRLDATNIVKPFMCVLSSISLEHSDLLGDTIEKIAEEKAAIIKPECKLVIIEQQEESVTHIIDKRCVQCDVAFVNVVEHCKFVSVSETDQGQELDILTENYHYKKLQLPLIGEHQRHNVATAISCVEGLVKQGVAVAHEAIYKGCQEVVWPGRMEIFKRDRLYLLDSAHNRASAHYLADTIKNIFSQRRVVLVLGLSRHKDKSGICDELARVADHIIVTQTKHARSEHIDLVQAQKLFPDKECEVKEDVAAVFAALNQFASTDLILFTGSIFLVAEARQHLEAEVSDA